MATAAEKREQVAAKYRTILGRNIYSQDRRNYCYKKYSNGKYYSDCSSSVSYTYKECGYGFGILNTAGMYNSTKFVDVPVIISKGQITNPEVLRVGDMLLYAGTNNSRPGCVGHVEMLGEINGSKYILYGHGSGNPKKTEMTSKNKSRYNSKTSTKVGNKGLIRVRRFIVDDGNDAGYMYSFTILHVGARGTAVTEMQEALMSLGYDLPEYGADGDFGEETKSALMKFQSDRGLEKTGVYDGDTDAALKVAVEALAAQDVRITGSSVNVRSDHDISAMVVGVAHRNDLLPYCGEQVGTWFRVTYDGKDCWVSSKYSEIVKRGV